ncbi:hypothetical protein RB597_006084 [Gaeumannomyces tritici]
MSDANGPQALYSSGPEPVKHDSDYPQLHIVTPQQGQGWQGQPHTPETSYGATSPPPPQHQQMPAMTTAWQNGHQQEQQQHEKHTGDGGRSPRHPDRLLASAACLLLGIIIGGAVVGGALGSMLAGRPAAGTAAAPTAAAECKTSPASNQSTASSAPPAAGTSGTVTMLTNYEAASWRNVSTLAFPCPRQEGLTVTAFEGSRFGIECGIDSAGLGTEAPGTTMEDLQSAIAYSFEDCVFACASLNRESPRVQKQQGLSNPSVVCRTVVWRARMDEDIFKSAGGNCFLKNATRAAGGEGRACPQCMSGTLL